MTEAEKLWETAKLVRKAMAADLEENNEDLEKDILRAAYVPDGDKAGEALQKMTDKMRRDEKAKAIGKVLDAATKNIRACEDDMGMSAELGRQQDIYLIVDHCGFSVSMAESFIKMGLQADEVANKLSRLSEALKSSGLPEFYATLTKNNERRMYGAPMISRKRYRHERKGFAEKKDKRGRRNGCSDKTKL